MSVTNLNILLADDDMDDCAFFEEALQDLELSSTLTVVNDGVQLMHFLLGNINNLPQVLFLDLNMPRKSGFECLSEIKKVDWLKNLPVIIFSTSLDKGVADLLYDMGAHYYIRKPGEYFQLKKAVFKALTMTTQNNFKQPGNNDFILEP